jgi:hypothetical protein
MSRRLATRAATGVILIALACGAAVLSRGVDEAAREFQSIQADWQRGLVTPAPAPPGGVQEVAESLLGIQARSDVMRAYLEYRIRLASVIQGTLYPQTQARWNAISTIGKLRRSLTTAHDRAAVDVTLGLVLASTAVAAGPTTQREALQRNAVAAFRRGVLEDPANAEAKYDLEALLAGMAAAESRARSTSSGQRGPEGKPTSTPQTQPEGSGY